MTTDEQDRGGDHTVYPRSSQHAFDPGSRGLTKRELFAAMAMQGMLADPNVRTDARDVVGWAGEIAEHAVILADELVEKLRPAT